jgi:hypothetical protein
MRGIFRLTHGGFFERAADVRIYLEAKGEEETY